MRLLLLFIAPVLYAQSVVVVQAGALSCGAVKRATDQIQTYCYAPGKVLVHNTIETLNTAAVMAYQWCVGVGAVPAGCTASNITWQFTRKSAGIDYQVTTDGVTYKHGTLFTIFGSVSLVGTLVNGVCMPHGTGFHWVQVTLQREDPVRGLVPGVGYYMSNEPQANCYLQ